MVTTELLGELHRAHVATIGNGYAAALAAHGWDAVVLHGGSPKIRSMFDDQYWPVRPTPHFQHWTPLVQADAAVIIRPGKRPTLVRNVARDFWDGHPADDGAHAWASFDVVEANGPSGVKAHLPTGKLAFIGEDRSRAGLWGLPDDAVNPPGLLRALDALRVAKTPYEVACLAEANRRAALGHRRVAEAFAGADGSELELHLAFLGATEQDDAETPYKNIVALDRHAATLHHVHYGRRREGARTLLLDAGATFHGYASDVTRTYVKGTGAEVELFAQLVARVERLQLECCARVKAGLGYEALHDGAHELLAPVLRDLGLAHGSDQALVDGGVTRAFFPHGLGHSLGVQTHDVGCADLKPRKDNPFLRNTTTIAPGQSFTIEPGCYFIDDLLGPLEASKAGELVDWPTVKLLTPLGGVRIEDDLVVLDGGLRNLTREVLA